jgi:hypothetical protein
VNYSDLPIEWSIGGVYFPPLLFASILGTFAAALIARILNYFGLSRYVWHPPLFFVALAVICTGLIGIYVIPV